MRSFRLFLLTCCLFAAGMAQAQTFPDDSITKKFDAWRKQALQEKVYVRTDRSGYVTGELMWFKIYCVDGYRNRPMDISKVVYLELLGEGNEIVLQRKIEMANGFGTGSMFVPASLSSGNYALRAYTNWMKNFGPEYFFHSTISIVNTFVKTSAPVAKANSGYDVQFFPEGGDLVAGLHSKVAFRVADATGKGIIFRGAIVDEKNDTVAHFKPGKFGIGHFYMTPAAGSKYRAVITDQSRRRSSHPLRDVKESGYVMRLIESNDVITVDISASSQADNYAPVYLFTQSRESIVSKEVRQIQSGKATFRINRSSLPAGITHITLFDKNLQPTAERLYFTRPSSAMTIEGKTPMKIYSSRQKIRVDINSGSDANVSVSVFRNDSLPVAGQSNLFEYLWLSSDLKGAIESPEYYFSANDTTVASATDNLMLTHGWRRFAWSSVLKNKPSFTYLPEHQAHIIRGTVLNQQGQPANGVLTYLAAPEKFVRTYGSRSNSKGEVQFEVKDFYGNKRIYAQTNWRVDSTFRIRIANPFSEQYAAWPLAPITLPPAISKQLLERSVAMQVQDIYYRDQVNHFLPPGIDSVQFYGKADEIYNLDDYTRFPIMEEVLREYVPGVMVRKKRDGFHFMVIDKLNKSLFRDDPMVLIDGVPVFNADKVMAFDPLRIKRLEILDKEYYEGILALPGVMSFFTYANDLGGFPIDERAVQMDYDGLQVQREFFAPKYENTSDKQLRLPDHRTLLYWNPLVLTKKGETSAIEFYTSDVPGNYTILVEGISKNGEAGTSSNNFSVTKLNP
ncbi:MAG: hypothetical protein WDO14_02240 [Bacteroidota bacterium]